MKSVLHIHTAARNGITYLKESFCTQPFKLANVTERKNQPLLQLMLMSSSPGMLDRDVYEMKIDIAAGTHLLLSTQSYQRLFNMVSGAHQTLQVTVEKDSSFCFIPHPVVPHQDAIFQVENSVYLSERSTLVWGEIFTCGRHGNGERFLFSKYHSLTKIYKNNILAIQEHMLLQPAQMNLQSLGQFEGYTHVATLIFLNDYCDAKALTDAVTLLLKEQAEITFGITLTRINGFVLRILGFKAELLYDLLQKIYHTFLITQKEIIHAS